MSNEYFTDKEFGPKPRIQEEIEIDAWGGIVSLINNLINNGSFGLSFPSTCPDGSAIFGTDENSMALAVKAEISELSQWKKEKTWGDEEELVKVEYWPLNPRLKPKTYVILDLICFCYRHVAKPIQFNWHSYHSHHHLKFEQQEGQFEFCQNINRIFSRNGLMYEIKEDGNIIRIPPLVVNDLLKNTPFNTGDHELNSMLATACNRYLDPNIDIRRESLEKLWDAWERIKTLLPGKDKKSSTESLLEKASSEEHFRELLNKEAIELTRIGNDFQIRHSETTKIPVKISDHIDYLFHRLFSMINLLLKAVK